jgi:hypothetical protein
MRELKLLHREDFSKNQSLNYLISEGCNSIILCDELDEPCWIEITKDDYYIPENGGLIYTELVYAISKLWKIVEAKKYQNSSIVLLGDFDSISMPGKMIINSIDKIEYVKNKDLDGFCEMALECHESWVIPSKFKGEFIFKN